MSVFALRCSCRACSSCLAVPAEVRASYIVIIDRILSESDLNTVSSKRVREGLQKEVPYDIGPQKVYIVNFSYLLGLISSAASYQDSHQRALRQVRFRCQSYSHQWSHRDGPRASSDQSPCRERSSEEPTSGG